MANKGMRDFTAIYDGVNPIKFDADGDFFHVQNVSVGGANVLLRFDEGPLITRQQGEGNRVYYSRVEVSASAACTITLQLGYGYATDGRASVNANINTTLAAALHNPALATVVCGAGAQTSLAAADPNQIEIAVGLASTAANGIFIGDITTANNVGLFVEPGQIVWVGTAAQLYAWNPGAGAISVSLMKTRNI